jgi:nucleoside-diphosphate-sugar epimerase
LAWRFHPTRHPDVTWRDNVVGTERVLAAAAATGVGAVIVASSIGAYSPGGEDRADESWPTLAIPDAAYGLQKSYVERILDSFEAGHPGTRVVRVRPAFVFKHEAAPEQRRIFAGPLLPGWLLVPGRLPVLPLPTGFRMQAVHADDLAEAFVAAVERDVSGAFNVAADPVLGAADFGELLGTRTVEVPPRLVRMAMAAAFRLRLIPAEPGLFDLFRSLPVMDSSRAVGLLGWRPRYTALEAVRSFLSGLTDPTGGPTPRLGMHAGGPARIGEVLSRLGDEE